MISYRNSIRNLNTYVPGKPVEEVQRELGLDKVIKLASNENPLGCSKSAKEAIINSLGNIAVYPDGNCSELRKKLSAFHGIAPEWFVFGCGTDEVISMLAGAFIDDSDEMITACNTFSQYAQAVDAMGGVTVYAPMLDYTFDLTAIIDKISPKTKLIFIANPNNPTGTMNSSTEVIEFIKKVPSDILIVFDEAYSEYVDDVNYPNTLELVKEFDNVVLLKTFSKAYGLASLRVGYGIMRPELVELLNRIRKPFNVSIAAQEAAIAAIADQDFISLSVSSNLNVKNYLYNEFNRMGLSFIPTQANFVMVDVKKDSNKLFTQLLKRGFIVRSGSAFAMDTFLRISIGTMAQMKEFIIVLEDVLNSGGDIE